MNHAFFNDHTADDADSIKISDTIQNDDTCLDIINDMKFDIGVQSFSQNCKLSRGYEASRDKTNTTRTISIV